MKMDSNNFRDDDDETTAAAFVLFASHYLLTPASTDKSKIEKKDRDFWVREWLQKRNSEGLYSKLLQELRYGDMAERTLFRNFLRMTDENFVYLLNLLKPFIEKRKTKFREPIPAGERLALTLHFLSTGNSFHSLQYLFRIHQSTISKIIPEVLDAIWLALKNEYVKFPSSQEEWGIVADTFNQWNYPNCIGAIDGKHVVMCAPSNSGSINYNYKHTHSIVLLAICDGNYKFIYIDAGVNGRISDGGIFNDCSFAKALERVSLHLPAPQPLRGRNVSIPHVLVADDAFALKPNIMKPFSGHGLPTSQRIFNYRLSRARRCIENAFGIMSSQFRVLRSPIKLDAAKTRKIILACCALHNLLITTNAEKNALLGTADKYKQANSLIEGDGRQENAEQTMYPLERIAPRHESEDARKVRQEFEAYFSQLMEK